MAKKAPSRKKTSTYTRKRKAEQTPEPPATYGTDVDPTKARPGDSFVIHQHHATRLHFDLRLEMFNGRTPVLVSWAVPKGMPHRKGKPALAIHVEDHPFEYGTFSGSIPAGNYGAGEVRIFDHGSYEMVDREPGKLTFRLKGERLRSVYYLMQKSKEKGKDEWLLLLKEDEREPDDPPPPPDPMLPSNRREAFNDKAWAFEPVWDGERAIAVCDDKTMLVSSDQHDVSEDHKDLRNLDKQLVALNAILDGVIVSSGKHDSYVAFDLLYLDGRSLVDEPFEKRRKLLEETVVPVPELQLSPLVRRDGTALYDAAVEQKLPGIVGKRLSSPYETGKRSKSWLKIAT